MSLCRLRFPAGLYAEFLHFQGFAGSDPYAECEVQVRWDPIVGALSDVSGLLVMV